MSFLNSVAEPEVTGMRVWRVVRRESATYEMIVLAPTREQAREAQDAQVAASSVSRAVDILSVDEMIPGGAG